MSALLSLRGGLFGVAGESAIKQVVPDEAMGRAQAANQARDAAISLAGGPLGGVLLGVGSWLVGVAMALCQTVSMCAAAVLRRGSPANDGEAPAIENSSPWEQARSGVAWVFRRPDLRGVLVIATIVNLGFNAGMTTVIYSLRLEGYSPQAIGGATAVVSATMLVAAIISPVVVSRLSAGVLVVAGLVLGATGIIIVGQVHAFGAIIATLALSVIGIPALNAALIGYLTVATPSHLLGRVNSGVQVLAMGAMPLAPLIAGFGLAQLGRTGTLYIAAGLCVAAVALAAASPSVRALPREAKWAEHAAHFDQRGSTSQQTGSR